MKEFWIWTILVIIFVCFFFLRSRRARHLLDLRKRFYSKETKKSAWEERTLLHTWNVVNRNDNEIPPKWKSFWDENKSCQKSTVSRLRGGGAEGGLGGLQIWNFSFAKKCRVIGGCVVFCFQLIDQENSLDRACCCCCCCGKSVVVGRQKSAVARLLGRL